MLRLFHDTFPAPSTGINNGSMMPYSSSGNNSGGQTSYSGQGGGGTGGGSAGGGGDSSEPSALSQLSESVSSLDPLAAMEKSMHDTVRTQRISECEGVD